MNEPNTLQEYLEHLRGGGEPRDLIFHGSTPVKSPAVTHYVFDHLNEPDRQWMWVRPLDKPDLSDRTFPDLVEVPVCIHLEDKVYKEKKKD